MKTYRDVFVLREGKVTQWRLKNGQLVVCEKDGAREIPYDSHAYWSDWAERMRFHFQEDCEDAVFLADRPNAFEGMPTWHCEDGATSGWDREGLELLGEEPEFQNKTLVLVIGGEKKVLFGGSRGTDELILEFQSTYAMPLDDGVTDEVDRLRKEAEAVEAPAESPRKQELLAICGELGEVVAQKSVEYGDAVEKRLAALEDEIASYVFRVNLVGPFSCGKSSLINRWLKMPHLLPTGIAPETAISTELRYGAVPRMVLYPLNQGAPEVTLEGVTSSNMALVRERANHGELVNVIVYLNHPLLKAYADLCLVDLPGLNSANPAHEAALDRFIEDQEAGIFCVPMADGTVQGDALEYLRKMELFHSRFNLLLTKADEREASEHAAIMDAAGRKIRSTLGISQNDFSIGKVSANSVEDFVRMLDDFQRRKDEYLTGRFSWEIKGVASEIEGPLRKAVAMNYNNSALEESMAAIEAAQRNLPETMEEILDDVRQEIDATSGRILEKVKRAVMSQKSTYLAMAKRGEDCSGEVSSLVRSTIAHEAGNEMQEVIARANERVGKVFGERLRFDAGNVDEVYADVEGAGNLSVEPGFIDTGWGAALGGLGAGSVGGIIGNIILPGIGGVIGGILGGLLIGAWGDSRQEDRESKIDAEFTVNLDSACNNTRPQIVQVLSGAVEAYGNDLKASVDGKLQALMAQAKQLKDEFEAGREAWEAKKEERTGTLNQVLDILSKLENWNG